MVNKVSYSKNFLKLAATLSDQELHKIRSFITSVETNKTTQLPGRNKPSTDVSTNHVNRDRLIQYALDNHLWHYHTGHVSYRTSNPIGDWTSSHVLHYQNLPLEIRLVHYDCHPPLLLPRWSLLL